jgi:hypothetical protein
MTDGRTHWEGCWQEAGHHDCATAALRKARAEVERLREAAEEVAASPTCSSYHRLTLRAALQPDKGGA